MSEAILTVKGLKKSFGENNLLDGIDFEVDRGEVVVIIGPSGCGKSTLLRCINALEPTSGGEIRIGDTPICYGAKDLPKIRQRIGMVFQSYDLFPHKNVLDNITLAPVKVQKRNKKFWSCPISGNFFSFRRFHGILYAAIPITTEGVVP